MRFQGSLLLLSFAAVVVFACSDDATSTSTGTAQTSGMTEAASTSSTSASSTTSASTSGSGSGTGGMGAGGMAAFGLTSTGFTDGSVIPTTYACAPKGMNLSPDLTWTSGPQGTLSYAVILTDKSNDLIHWVIWDIPSNVVSIPEHIAQVANPPIPAGAKQAKSYDDATFGYLGPCPPSTHTYQFAVHALDIATLPQVTTASTRAEVDAAVTAHELATATLTATYTP